MSLRTHSKRPELTISGTPCWWNPPGAKFFRASIYENDSPERMLILATEKGSCTITKDPNIAAEGWIIVSKIIHTPESWSECRIWMHERDLKVAFDLSDEHTCEVGQDLIDRFGADFAHYGRYIRWGDFLNLPGPGTGRPGDANLSIFITGRIQKAIKNFRDSFGQS